MKVLVYVKSENLRKVLNLNVVCGLYSEHPAFFRIYGLNGDLHDIDKEHGIKLFSEDEFTAVHQELLQRREEVAELMQQVEEGERRKKRNYADYLRDLNELREEKGLLLQQIERTVNEQKPVVLPRDVAEALEELKKEGKTSSFIAWAGVQRDERPVSPKRKCWETIYEFARWKDNIFALVDALRYGYTAEDAHVEKQELLIEKLRLEGYNYDRAKRIAEIVASTMLETEKAQQSG